MNLNILKENLKEQNNNKQLITEEEFDNHDCKGEKCSVCLEYQQQIRSRKELERK